MVESQGTKWNSKSLYICKKDEIPSQIKKNIMIVGTTGNGKSFTANTIIQRGEFFPVGSGLYSKTIECKSYELPWENAWVIDTPGFGNMNLNEEEVNRMIFEKAQQIMNEKNSSGQIDLFLCIQQADPNLSTLSSDLKQLSLIFGTVCFQSMIILVIDKTGVLTDASISEFFADRAKDVVRQLTEGLGHPPESSIAMKWDNIHPTSEQIDCLFKSMKKDVHPYTMQKMNNFIQEKGEAEKRKMEEKN